MNTLKLSLKIPKKYIKCCDEDSKKTLEGQNLIKQKLGPIQENIRKQANSIKKMKQDENPYVKDEISVLKKMKKELEELEKQILLAMGFEALKKIKYQMIKKVLEIPLR